MNAPTELVILYNSEANLVQQLRQELAKREPWLRPKEAAKKFNLPSAALWMRIKAFKARGGDFPQQNGPSGRILWLQLTPELVAVLSAPLLREKKGGA